MAAVRHTLYHSITSPLVPFSLPLLEGDSFYRLGYILYRAGHSLGGALATLAAYDIQAACDCRDKLDLSCYTFGAPRTGNHAFAHDYNHRVG